MQAATWHLLNLNMFKALHFLRSISIFGIVLSSLILRTPSVDFLILVYSNRMFITRWELHDISEARYQLRLSHKLRSLGTKSKLTALIVAPWVNKPAICDGHSMSISATNIFYKLVFQNWNHSWIQYFLGDRLHGQVRKAIVSELSLCIGSPGVENTMHIPFVNGTHFSIYDGWVRT